MRWLDPEKPAIRTIFATAALKTYLGLQAKLADSLAVGTRLLGSAGAGELDLSSR
jgi:hypothetical protein